MCPSSSRPRFKIGRLGLRGGANLALAFDQGCLGGPETPIHARKGSGLAEISAMQGVAPPEAGRRVSLEISGLRGGAISALAVAQVYLGGHETPIRARKGSGIAEISAIQGVAPPEAERRLSLEINFSGLRGGVISALAFDQVYLDGPETRIRAGESSAYAEISLPYQCCKAEQHIEISASIFSDSR